MKPLTERERVCLDCPLDDCDEQNERCLWAKAQFARKPTRWGWLHEMVDKLQPGDEPLVVRFDSADECKRGGNRVQCRVIRRGMPVEVSVKTTQGRFMMTARRTDG